jgi:hypothetical protein
MIVNAARQGHAPQVIEDKRPTIWKSLKPEKRANKTPPACYAQF